MNEDSYYSVVPSPIGDLVFTGDGRSLTGLSMDADLQRVEGEGAIRDDGSFTDVAEQLDAYWDGRLADFDVPLAPKGTPFQLKVWDGLRRIPYGRTVSYGTLARRIGRTGAARAVGLANNRNPIAIIVPCHRVIGADGSLVGYGGGLERKRLLLDLEARTVGRLTTS